MKWNWAQLYWIFVWGLLGFCPLEFIALATGHPEWTLSDTVWHIEGYGNPRIHQTWNPLTWSFGHIAFVLGLIWLFGHFADRIWR
jgi:hypothetical protein